MSTIYQKNFKDCTKEEALEFKLPKSHNPDFKCIHAHPMEFSYPSKYAEVIKEMLLKIAESHAIEVITVDDLESKYIDYKVIVPRTTFANSYAAIGGAIRDLYRQGKINTV